MLSKLQIDIIDMEGIEISMGYNANTGNVHFDRIIDSVQESADCANIANSVFFFCLI